MSCPTCSHTMACLYAAGGAAIYHCGRCGTVRQIEGRDEARETSTFVPKLVERCRVYYDEAVSKITTKHEDVWRRRGLSEAINLPKDRRPPTKETV